MNTQAEIVYLWYELIKTQYLLQKTLKGVVVTSEILKLAEHESVKLVQRKFPNIKIDLKD